MGTLVGKCINLRAEIYFVIFALFQLIDVKQLATNPTWTMMSTLLER